MHDMNVYRYKNMIHLQISSSLFRMFITVSRFYCIENREKNSTTTTSKTCLVFIGQYTLLCRKNN